MYDNVKYINSVTATVHEVTVTSTYRYQILVILIHIS